MSKKPVLLSLSLLLAICLVLWFITRVTVQAQEEPFGKGTYREEYISPEMDDSPMFIDKESTKIMKYLNPTIKQRQKLHKINMDFLKDTIDLNNEEGQKLLKRHETRYRGRRNNGLRAAQEGQSGGADHACGAGREHQKGL